MKRFRNILVFVNDVEDPTSLLDSARAIAARNTASLTIYDVVPEIPQRRRFVDATRKIDLGQLLYDTRHAALHGYAERGESVAVGTGTPFVEVIKQVMDADHDLVLTTPSDAAANHGLGGATTTLHLLRKCPVPVLVDQPYTREQRNVVAAVGPFDPGGETSDLDVTIVQLADSLAARRNGTAHFVHAWRLPGETLMRSRRVEFTTEQVDALRADAITDAERGMENLLRAAKPLPGLHEVHIVEGNAPDVIPKMVADTAAGVVVMGTLARTGVRGMFIGNTAERLIGQLDASILAVKPPGFVSPVAG